MVLNKSNEDYENRIKSFEESHQAKINAMSNDIADLEKQYEEAKSIEVKSNADVVYKLEAAIEKLEDDYASALNRLRSMQSKES